MHFTFQERDKMKDNKYHTVGTVKKISHCRDSSKNITLSEQFQNPIEISTVGTVPKSNRTIAQRESIHQAYIYMTARFSSLKQGL